MHNAYSLFLIAIMLSSIVSTFQTDGSIYVFADKTKSDKITICHIPPGNPSNVHTISVSQKALDAHLTHGDILGECGQVDPEILDIVEEIHQVSTEYENNGDVLDEATVIDYTIVELQNLFENISQNTESPLQDELLTIVGDSLQQVEIAIDFVLSGDETQANSALSNAITHMSNFVSVVETHETEISSETAESLIEDAQAILENLNKRDLNSLELISSEPTPVLSQVMEQINDNLLNRQLLLDELESNGVVVSAVAVEGSPEIPKIIGQLGSIIFDLINLNSKIDCGTAIATSINAAATFKGVDLLSNTEEHDVMSVSGNFCSELSSKAFFDGVIDELDSQNHEFLVSVAEFHRTPFIFEKQHNVATKLNLPLVKEFWSSESGYASEQLIDVQDVDTYNRILDTVSLANSIISGIISGIVFTDNGDHVYNQLDGDEPIADADVIIKNIQGVIIDSFTTDLDGEYVFPNLATDLYSISLNPVSGFEQTFPNPLINGDHFESIIAGSVFDFDDFANEAIPTEPNSCVHCVDFNGDGFEDIAIGASGEDLGGIHNAGASHTIYGSSSGLDALSPLPNQFWTLDLPELSGTPQDFDSFGLRMGTGDFNGDGYTDISIISSERLSADPNDEGAAHIIYGSSNGLDTDAALPNQIWTHGDLDEGLVSDGATFSTVVSGDFNNDGFDDLVLGSSEFGFDIDSRDGIVQVIYGSSSGLDTSAVLPNQLWTQDSPGLLGTTPYNLIFGTSLTVNDFNGDGFDDLAIGVDGEFVESSFIGAVHIIFGSTSGLNTGILSPQFITQETLGIIENDSDRFTRVLTSNDFNNDGFFDLAISDPEFEINGDSSGAVHLIFGSSSGLDTSAVLPTQLWTQTSPGLEDSVDESYDFGASVFTGDFNGDGFFDLAIGSPSEDLFDEFGLDSETGLVHIIYGSVNGPDTSIIPSQTLYRLDIDSAPADDGLFGIELFAADFNGDGFDDLAVSFRDNGTDLDPKDGAVYIVYGSTNGLETDGILSPQLWSQDSPNIPDVTEPNDSFGRTLPK